MIWSHPEDLTSLEAWARLYVSTDQTESAVAILRWLVTLDIAQPRSSLGAKARLERLELYLDSLPDDRREAEARRILTASLPSPIDPLYDWLDGMLIRRALKTGDATLTASTRQACQRGLDRAGPRSYLPRVHRACAYDAAVHENRTAFARHVGELIRLTPLSYGNTHPADPLEFLPTAQMLSDPSAWGKMIEQAVEQSIQQGALSPSHATRTLVLLGQWYLENGLAAHARDLLPRVLALAGDAPCERWLWVIDLIAALDPKQARVMSREMLAAGLLPAPRIADLLNEIEQAAGPEEADRLAFAAAKHGDHQCVLERALRHARREQYQTVIAALEKRLGDIETARSTSQPP
jgi:hypothetical protein